MNTIYRNFVISSLVSIGIGFSATMLVVNSENGYVAGFIFLPLFLFICVASLILFIVGLISLGLENKSWAWLLLSAFLLPASFFSACLIAKYFEIGAYRQEPMISFLDEVNNVIVFKEGTTNKQVNDFWQTVMSLNRDDGRGYSHLPGVRTMTRLQSQNGREAIGFSFFPNATEEQKQFVFAKVKSSPMVYQFLENQSIKEFSANSAGSSSTANSDKPTKKVSVTNLTNSK